MSAQLETKTGHGLDSLAQLTEGLSLPHHEDAPTPAPTGIATTNKPSGDVVNINHHRKVNAPARKPRPARQPERTPVSRAAEGGQRQRRERGIIVLDVFLAEDTKILLQAIRQCKENDCDAVVSLSLAQAGPERTKLEFSLEIVGGDRILMRVLRGAQGLFGWMFDYESGYILFRDEILRDVETPLKRKNATEGVTAMIQLIESHRNATRARLEAQAQAQAKQD